MIEVNGLTKTYPGDVQAVNAAPSREHWKATVSVPLSSLVNVKAALGEGLGAAGWVLIAAIVRNLLTV